MPGPSPQAAASSSALSRSCVPTPPTSGRFSGAAAPQASTTTTAAELLGTLPPDEAIARAYREYDYRMREIAGALGCHYATISRRLRAFENNRVS